ALRSSTSFRGNEMATVSRSIGRIVAPHAYPRSLGPGLLIGLAIIVLAAAPIAAQTWDGGGGANINWSTATNWNPDGTPANNGTANIVFALAGTTQLKNIVVDRFGRRIIGHGVLLRRVFAQRK